ncbi:hypothetical protein SAY87_020998 [Trapa incisa]|uniref:RING-type E3 ubiquitin transferase n=1 Tax=Trapa incisa TaxID=236973 RepID=A0AAN7JRV7_9MYRT|nr:hypothetical protein SAY87_020998 [Trapa incisa]
MGGCCCSLKGHDVATPTAYNYSSTTSVEQVPLPTNHGTAIVLSPGFLADMNLDMSIPDTYRSPPPPAPYDLVLGDPQTAREVEQATGDEGSAAVKRGSPCCPKETAAGNKIQDRSVKVDDLKCKDCTENFDFNIEKEKGMETDHLKSVDPLISPEECPTCLEEYDADNPKIITKCEHHFHLACLLEWLERSDTCPVCGEEMVFDPLLVSNCNANDGGL